MTETPSAASAERSFDLTAQPWLPVVGLDGQPDLVGLETLLREAHRFRALAGETPTMTAALHRMLIALIHRIYGPPSQGEWGRLWAAERLPTAPVTKYFKGAAAGRFDLLHPRQPFLQTPALSELPMSSAAKLVPYLAVGNNVTLFDHTTAVDEVRLAPDEAARWLVTLQAFDPGGMKTPFRKDKSSERAPCNHFGVVLLEGATLKDTLLLNTVVYDPKRSRPNMTTPADRPAWESPGAPDPQPDRNVPRGWTDLLTWPSRRVLLSGTAAGIDGAVITPGVRLATELLEIEMMAAFRQPLGPRGTPKKDAPMLPVRLHPLRGVWRHSAELLITDMRAEGRSRQRPRLLTQLANLARAGYVPRDAVYTLRVFGQQLDSKASVVEAWLEEAVAAPVPLLRAEDTATGALIGWAVTLADQAGSALRALQDHYRTELRARPVSNIDIGYWPKLAAPFNEFLRALGTALAEETSQTPAINDWARQVRRHAQDVAQRWMRDTGPGARSLLAAGRQYEQFQRRLNAALVEFRNRGAAHTTTREPA